MLILDIVSEIQTDNHLTEETESFFTFPIKDVMNMSMISAHHQLGQDNIDEDVFQVLTHNNLDTTSEHDDQGFSEDSKAETEPDSSKLNYSMTPELRSAPPIFSNHSSISFDEFFVMEKPELPVISEDDERKHAISISECETLRQKSLDQDFPSEPEELPPDPEEFELSLQEELGLPEKYLSVPEESNQENESQEEEDLFPLSNLSVDERSYIAHPRSSSDHILSSRLQRSSLGAEPTMEFRKEPEARI
jgi:hypothetical protein